MRIAAILLFLSCNCSGWEHDKWLYQAEQNIDQKSVDWLREQMKEGLPDIDPLDHIGNPCKHCLSGELLEMETKVLVCISFSVPEESWLKLSSEMEPYAGHFVIRGLPNNSFQELAKRLGSLKKRGMNTPVQIDPQLFDRFQIERVPTFVLVEGSEHHKITGNISLEYALDTLSKLQREPLSEEMAPTG